MPLQRQPCRTIAAVFCGYLSMYLACRLFHFNLHRNSTCISTTQIITMTRPAYSATFEDDVMHAVLDPSVSNSTPEAPTDNPIIPSSALPLPLSDSRRVHNSKVPGIKLTEPNGSMFGGSLSQQLRNANAAPSTPARSPTGDPEADIDILAALRTPLHVSSGRTSQNQLSRALNAATETQLNELRKRMKARKEALEINAEVERELADLKAQRDVEVRIEKRMREEAGQRGSED